MLIFYCQLWSKEKKDRGLKVGKKKEKHGSNGKKQHLKQRGSKAAKAGKKRPKGAPW